MNTFLQKLKKINFKQPKYILPLMGYVLILFVVYMIIDIANTDVKKVKDDGLQTTEYINSTIPDARLKGDGVGSKYENMTRQYGAVTDLSAVNSIDRNEEEKKEEYESKYSDDDIALLGDSSATSATVKPKPKPAKKAAKPKPAPKRSQSEEEIYAELEKALAEARLQGTKAVGSVKDNADTVKAAGSPQSNALAAKPHVSTANKDSIGEVVKKVRVNSDYFNTICDNEPESGLIKAIIDENIKAVDGSRVRLRLLDDVEVSGIIYVLMIIQRLIEAYSLLRPLSEFFAPMMRVFGLPRQSAYMWLVGNVLGISYGSAVMLELEEKGIISRDDANDVNFHLIMNHSLLEDTIVFGATGISALLLVATRVSFAIVLVWSRRGINKLRRA